ncbi:hypothetical protein E2L07_17785 [Halalkalibacterium halodurans]|nr:hypothetical protein E2L07_17785 [Halalkalibacterium halodurans]
MADAFATSTHAHFVCIRRVSLPRATLQLPREPHSRRSSVVAFPAGVARCRSKEPTKSHQHKNRENLIKRFSRFYV